MNLIQIYEKVWFCASEYCIDYKMNVINYRNTTESSSVPHHCVSVESGLDVYETLGPNIQIKACEQTGPMLEAEILHFILKMKNRGKTPDLWFKLNLQNIYGFKKSSRQQVIVFIIVLFLFIWISMLYSTERKLEKWETTYGSDSSVFLYCCFFLLQLWIPMLHFTEKEWLLVQLFKTTREILWWVLHFTGHSPVLSPTCNEIIEKP